MITELDIESGLVDLSHGVGGKASAQLVEQIFHPAFANAYLDKMDDGALLPNPGERLVVSTDSHVVSPIFFPGGDIGSLSIHGSVNDVAMMGGRPRYITAGFILEEGLPLSILKQVVDSMGVAAQKSSVALVAADTKVVRHGEADQIFITTTCIGTVADSVNVAADRIRAGDQVLVSGTIGDHGSTILTSRDELGLDTDLKSDSQPLHDLVQQMLKSGAQIRFLRDPTRGGVATVLNEIAEQTGLGICIREAEIPVTDGVQAVSELLGLDPLYLACEGRLVVICAAADAGKLLQLIRSHTKGKNAAVIGEIVADARHPLVLQTAWGSSRIVPMLSGEQMPRIC
jgi:hydrogenase expression/formation protein HypE